jgi:hypothetical protein
VKPDTRFLNLPKSFWANVRTISQHVGYTERAARRRGRKKKAGRIKVPTVPEMLSAMQDLGLRSSHIADASGDLTKSGAQLDAYFHYRAGVLNAFVEPRLMNQRKAKVAFQRLQRRLRPTCPIPMNKQKGKKKSPAFFTAIINMLIEANAAGAPCDYDPRELTTVTIDGAPLRTLARRVDGAFPGPVNPIAVWEIKEYYYTTTFGSRVADGVYETLLDGMELEELRNSERIDVKHYLMIDDHFTWWDCGRSYLCRIVDMLHMGYVDEVLFGAEVLERMPDVVNEWLAAARRRDVPAT